MRKTKEAHQIIRRTEYQKKRDALGVLRIALSEIATAGDASLAMTEAALGVKRNALSEIAALIRLRRIISQ